MERLALALEALAVRHGADKYAWNMARQDGAQGAINKA